MAPNLLSGGQHTVASAGATLDLLEQHFISLSRLHLHLFLNLDQQPAGTFSLAESCSFLLTILMILAWFPGQVRPFESVRHARHLMLGQHSQQRLRDLLQRVRSLSGIPSPMPFAAPSTAGSPFCSRCTTFPLNVSISWARFTTCIPVFSLGEDTPLTVSTLTPVSVDRTLSIESTDTPPDDLNDVPLPSFPTLPPAALFTLFASLLANPLLFAFEDTEERSDTGVLFTGAFAATLVPELSLDLEIVLASSCFTEPPLTTAVPLSVLEEFLAESFDDSTSLALDDEFDTTG